MNLHSLFKTGTSDRRSFSRMLSSLIIFSVTQVNPAVASDRCTVDEIVLKAMGAITSKSIMTHAVIISNEKYKGREAGRKGSRKSADYIIAEFQKSGLRPGGSAGTFFQSFKIQVGYKISSHLESKMSGILMGDYERKKDYAVIHLVNRRADISAPVVFAGYGITEPLLNFNEYEKINVRGKAVIVFTGVPWGKDPQSWKKDLPQKIPSHEVLSIKAKYAAMHGAKALLITDDPMGWQGASDADIPLKTPDLNSPLDSPIPVIHLTHTVIGKIMGISKKELKAIAYDIARQKAPESHDLRGRTIQFKAAINGDAWVGRNIIGVRHGSDPLIKKEALVIGAHYDHLGRDGSDTYFGANDNASGVSAILSIANAFKTLHRPLKRTILFVAFDAEEIGKRGSKYFVQHTPIPKENIVSMFNFDMIGKNESNQIFVVGSRSSSMLHQIHQIMNTHTGLNLTHPESFRLGRSDHTAFYDNRIPILYFFGGLDKEYNTPEDTFEKLLPEKIKRVAQLAFLTAFSIGNASSRPDFIEPIDHAPTGMKHKESF